MFVAQLLILFLVSLISGIIKVFRCTSTIIIKLVRFVVSFRNQSGGRVRLQGSPGSLGPAEDSSVVEESCPLGDQIYQKKTELETT